MMRNKCLTGLMIALLALLSPVLANAWQIDLQGTGGSISWSGNAADGIVGTGLPLNMLVADTPLNSGVYLLTGGHYDFVTGPYLGASGGIYQFGSGGYIKVYGQTSISGSTVPSSSGAPLLDGSFTNNINVSQLGGFGILSGAFVYYKDSSLLTALGLGDYTGKSFSGALVDIGLVSSLRHNQTTGSYTANVLSSQIVNVVPEPASLLLLGSGLVGLAGWGRKRFKS